MNSLKAFKNIVSGKSMSSLSTIIPIQKIIEKLIHSRNKKIFIDAFLCGFPRSGTHWILNVVQESTGIPTYEISKNERITNNRLILVKIHARNRIIAKAKAFISLPNYQFGGKYIYIYRDPRDAIISLYEMTKKLKNKKELGQKEFMKMYDPIGQYKWEINSWVRHKYNNVLTINFEDLKNDSLGAFKKIFNFLNIKDEVKIAIRSFFRIAASDHVLLLMDGKLKKTKRNMKLLLVK
ncbi:sulfotransferase domain-containing protein [bacterium]|nr:sulfotransferase domain-containing protein [bacterium]